MFTVIQLESKVGNNPTLHQLRNRKTSISLSLVINRETKLYLGLRDRCRLQAQVTCSGSQWRVVTTLDRSTGHPTSSEALVPSSHTPLELCSTCENVPGPTGILLVSVLLNPSIQNIATNHTCNFRLKRYFGIIMFMWKILMKTWNHWGWNHETNWSSKFQ